MNREVAYRTLSEAKKKDGDPVLGAKNIQRLKNLPDSAFDKFWKLFEDFSATDKLNSFPTYCSKWIDFFEFLSEEQCDFDDISQEVVDKYFNRYLSERSLEDRVNYIKKVFSFFEKEYIDVERYRPDKALLDDSKVKMERISAEDFAKAMDVYVQIRGSTTKNSKEYNAATKKLFVLQMFFYTPLSMRDVGKYQKGPGKHDADGIYHNGKKMTVPASLIELIEEMFMTGLFFDTNDIKSTVNQMKKDLAAFGMVGLDSKGAEKTREAIFMQCPQCGRKYLAIANNWCAKQYTEDGEYWVVCREKCGYE